MKQRDDGTAQKLTAEDAILKLESPVGAVFLSPTVAARVGRAADADSTSSAIAKMADAIAAGKRASAIVERRELGQALDALATVAREGIAGVVHVLSSEGASLRQAAGTGAAALGLAAAMVVSRTVQQSVDLGLCIHRAAEDAELPFVHWVDVQPGVSEVAAIPADPLAFLGNLRPAGDQTAHVASERAPFALASALRAGGEWLGRGVPLVERYQTLDAEVILFAAGAGARVAFEMVRTERDAGERVGAAETVALSPFYGPDLVKAMARAKSIITIEPFDDPLAAAGPLATSLKAAFADALTWAPGFPGVGAMPPIISVLPGGNTPAGAPTLASALSEIRRGDRVPRRIRSPA